MIEIRNDPCSGFSESDFEKLRASIDLLNNESFATKLTNAVGGAIEKGVELLSPSIHDGLTKLVAGSLSAALSGALLTMDKDTEGDSWDWFHKAVVTATGAAGGATGLAGAAVELPISTAIMLRSIADIARSHGEDLRSDEVRLSCLQVFALGSPNPEDDAAETGYWFVRAALSEAVKDAMRYASSQGAASASAPWLVVAIHKVAERFGVAVSQKMAAQAVPVLGGIMGAVVNYAFIDHFQDTARGHFTVRSLERKYGPDVVRNCFERIRADKQSKSSRR
jgi:EcsC protein family